MVLPAYSMPKPQLQGTTSSTRARQAMSNSNCTAKGADMIWNEHGKTHALGSIENNNNLGGK